MVRYWLASIAIVGAFAAYLVAQGDLFELVFVAAGVVAMFIAQRVQVGARRTIGREVQGAGPIVGVVAAPAAGRPAASMSSRRSQASSGPDGECQSSASTRGARAHRRAC
ncbi:MAG TPA: hypothetical protein VFH80_28970 [Solirubrobacteraceae bacterium]|nr:hypothetical protein [Solirubrobacteraceae bacterium]